MDLCPPVNRSFTTSQCIERLNQYYDIVFLDHDLGDDPGVGSGMDVVKWVAENKPQVKVFVVHSMNPVAAENMRSLLDNSGYAVYKIPFYKINHSVIKYLKRILDESNN